MTITDIKIRLVNNAGLLKAVSSVTFDDQFVVHDIKVIKTDERLFIVMPSKKVSNETYKDIAHPINSEFRSVLESSILEEFRKAVAEENVSEASE